MKQTVLTMIVAISIAMAMTTAAFAQQTRRTTTQKMTVQTAPAQSYQSSYYTAANEVTALLGFTAGAPNFGVDYSRMNGNWGYGGYFFMQSLKEKGSPVAVTLVSQIMSFGGLFKINVIDSGNVKFYVAPGAGITMVKDGASNSATGTKSDETVIGPVWKMAALYKLTTNFNIGLETTAFGNFFNDSLNNYTSPGQYYSVAGSFAF